MRKVNRRAFMTAAAGATLSLKYLPAMARAEQVDVKAPPPATLGDTGITMSRVGIGTGMRGGRRQSDHTRMGFEKLVGLFKHCYDRGVSFFDLADLYGSHLYFREALRSIPREKVSIMTKLWWRADGRKPAEVPVDYRARSAKMAIDRFREELSTDYLDIVLLHCLINPDWTEEMKPYMDALDEAKQQKKIKAVGVSCHNFGAMKTAANTPWVDVILARLNPEGVKCDAKPEEIVEVLKTARKNGKSILGMKIYGEGKLADQKDACIRYAQNNGVLDAMTVGAISPEQMDETLKLISKYPTAKLHG